MRQELTSKGIERTRAPATGQVDVWDRGVRGFGVRITKDGTRTFQLQTKVYRRNSATADADAKLGWHTTRVVLGRAAEMDLQDARNFAIELKAKARAGVDIRHLVRTQRATVEAAAKDNFSAWVQKFITRYPTQKGVRATTMEEYKRTLNSPYLASWHDKPVSTITKRDVSETVDDILHDTKGDKPIRTITKRDVSETVDEDAKPRVKTYAANRALACLSLFFNWLVGRGVIDQSPAYRVPKPGKETPRSRVLADTELAEIWHALDGEHPVGVAVARLLILLGQRHEEVAGMREEELSDLDGTTPLWTLPPERTKNGETHVLPLPALAVEIIKSTPRMKDNPNIFATRAAGHFQGMKKIKTYAVETIALRRAAGGAKPMAEWRWHDARRTLETRLADLGVAPHVSAAICNQVSVLRPGVSRAYNHSQYIDQKRDALNLWADHVAKVVAANPPADTPVTPGRKRRRKSVMESSFDAR